MRPGAQKHAMRSLVISNLNNLQLPSLDRLPNRLNLDAGIRFDSLEEFFQIRKPIRLDSRDVEAWSRHLDLQTNPIGGQRLCRNRFPNPPVLRNDHRFQFARNGSWRAIPYIVQINELERKFHAGRSVRAKMNMPCRPIRRTS